MGIIVRQGIKNNVITYVGVVIGFVNILILQPLILQPDELGLLRLLYSVAALFASIYPLGLNAFTLKYFPYIKDQQKGHHGYIGFILITSTVLFVLGSVVFYLCKPYFLAKYPDSKAFVEEFNYIFPLSYFLGVFTMLTSYSAALFKTTFPSFLNDILYRVLIVLALGLYFLHWISFDTLIIIYVFSYLLLVLLLIFYLKKTDVIRLTVNWSVFKKIDLREAAKFTVIMSVVGLASLSLKNIDAVFIASYINLAAVGVYTVAFTVSSMIDVPGSALSKIVLPQLSDAFKNGKLEQARRVYYQTNRVCLLSGSFLFLLVFVNTEEMLSFLPDKYGEGEWVLKICAIGSFINMAFGLNISTLQFSKNYVVGYIVLIGLAILSAMSNMILIPEFGVVGAAMGTAFSVVVVNLVSFFYVRRQFGFQPFQKVDGLVVAITLLIVGLDQILPTIPNEIISIVVKSLAVCGVFGLILKKIDLGPHIDEVLSLRFLKSQRKKKA
jgi:O-antigen/teichoic acid export membrane protein